MFWFDSDRSTIRDTGGHRGSQKLAVLQGTPEVVEYTNSKALSNAEAELRYAGSGRGSARDIMIMVNAFQHIGAMARR
jgi:hypothetical protein